jgi:hypothetical protein
MNNKDKLRIDLKKSLDGFKIELDLLRAQNGIPYRDLPYDEKLFNVCFDICADYLYNSFMENGEILTYNEIYNTLEINYHEQYCYFNFNL